MFIYPSNQFPFQVNFYLFLSKYRKRPRRSSDAPVQFLIALPWSFWAPIHPAKVPCFLLQLSLEVSGILQFFGLGDLTGWLGAYVVSSRILLPQSYTSVFTSLWQHSALCWENKNIISLCPPGVQSNRCVKHMSTIQAWNW